MTGLPVILGNHQTPNNTYMQVAGHGLCIASAALSKAAAKNPGLQKVFLKYVQAFVVQTSHTAIANAHGRLDERLARWILMAHDRTAGAVIPLTHEFLALMLGVRPPGLGETRAKLDAPGLGEHRPGGAA